MSEKYSIAVFDDGRRDVIPNDWIQDYLKMDSEQEDTQSHTVSFTTLEDFNSHLQYQMNKARESAVSEHEKHLHYVLNIIYEELKANNAAIKKLQKSVDCVVNIVSSKFHSATDPPMPAANLDEFLAIEDHIQIKSQYNDLVRNLSVAGGKTVEATTRKIWTKLCTTQLASTICWTGANGKFCLKNLSLNALVRDAVLKTFPQGKESEIQRATMLWFSHAQDRLRARRATVQDAITIV